MSMISSTGFKRLIPFWTVLVSFAAVAGYVCENPPDPKPNFLAFARPGKPMHARK